jgi:hypothetical protein
MKLFDLARKAVRRVLERRSLRKPITATIEPPVVEPPVLPDGRRVPLEPPVLPSGQRAGAGPQPPPFAPPPTREPPQGQPVDRRHAPQTPRITPREQRDIQQVQEVYDEITLIGRDASYDDAGAVDRLMDRMRQVSSSNVWGYYFETEGSPNTGLLYVTFLAEATSGGNRPQSPGSTYVYFDVPTTKYHEFARASDASAGKAVWDYLRVRGTVWQHQHRYKFLQNQGEYVPRKATQTGFRSRHQVNAFASKIPNETWSALSRLEKSQNPAVSDYGRQMRRDLLSKAGHRRSTLAPRSFLPNRAGPNRGRPNTGRP